MISKTFEEWTSALFNIGKLLALVSLGIWTVYQWNVSLFPKESFEAFSRRASRRTDLSVSIENVGIYKMMDFENDTSSLENDSGGTSKLIKRAYVVSGVCRFINEKDFPISLNIVSLSIRQGFPLFPEFSESSGNKNISLIEWEWIDHKTIDFNSGFGSILSEQPAIIEPKGKMILPLYFGIWLEPNFEGLYTLLELNIEAYAQALHPETGETIKESKKKKHLSYRQLLSEDFSDYNDIPNGEGGGKGSEDVIKGKGGGKG